MKIYSYPVIPQSVQQITHDKQGGAGQNAYQQNKKKQEEDSKEFEEAVSEAKVQDAIHLFAEDEQNKDVGITATQEGQGPGLRVLLKDSHGDILRNVSGEEFLKLKEAVRSGSRSGRLLDRKA